MTNFGETAEGVARPDGPASPTGRAELIERYLHLTRVVMPEMAKSKHRSWPVRNDHCFQRIVLDAVCGGVWYDHVDRPAYRNMSTRQASDAVVLCERILSGDASLVELNRQSLAWRGKLR